MTTNRYHRRSLASRAAALGAAVVAIAGVLALGSGTATAAAVNPTVTSVAPPQLGQNSLQNVTFTVQNMTANPTLTFESGTGVTKTSTPVVNLPAGTIAVSLRVDTAAPTGKVPFRIANGDGSHTDYTTSTSPLSVAAAPVLDSVAPVSLLQGVSAQPLTLSGHYFQSGMTVGAPAGSRLTFGTVAVQNTTTATVPVTVAGNAPTGKVALTLVNLDGGTSQPASVLTIDSFTVTGFSPASAANTWGASSVYFTVTGTNIPTSGTTLKLTPLSTAPGQDPIVAYASNLTATAWSGWVNFAGMAAGQYLVQLVNGAALGTAPTFFTLTWGGGSPTVSGVSPYQLGQGAETTLTVYGTWFTRGATVSFGKAGVTTTGAVLFDAQNQLRVPVKVDRTTSTGWTGVTVSMPTANGTISGTCSNCLYVNQGPSINGFAPSQLGRGAATTLTIYGSHFNYAPVVTFGSGMRATGPVSYISGSQLRVPVKVESWAATAGVTVKVQNPDFGADTRTLPITATLNVWGVTPQYVTTTYAGLLTVNGTGFASGATVAFPTGSGVAVKKGAVPAIGAGGYSLVVPIVVTRTTPLVVDVTVTNSGTDFGSVTCTACLGVAVAPASPVHAVATKTGTSATVVWTPVPSTATGGAPITGYVVSVVEPVLGVPAAQVLPATASSATFTGLDATTVYVFSVVAQNAAGLKSPVLTATTSRQPSTSIAVNATRIVAGGTVRVFGTLRDYAGEPIVGAQLTIWHRTDAGVARVLTTVTTDALGRWAVVAAPRHNNTYYAEFAGDAANWATVSTSVRTRVAPRVTIYSTAGSTVRSPFGVIGTVEPGKRGSVVRLVAIDPEGGRHHLGSTLVRVHSGYRFDVTLASGTWWLQVRIGATTGNVAGKSRLLKVRVV